MKKYIMLMLMVLIIAGCNQKPIEPAPKEDYTKEFLGDWHGTMRLAEQDVPIKVYLTSETAEITWTTKEQEKTVFSNVTYDEHKVMGKIIRDEQEIEVEAELTNHRIDGTYYSNEKSYPFTLVRGALIVENSEEPFLVEVKGGQLTTTLLTPQLPKMPLYIIVGGSGPTTKDGNTEGLGKNNSYLQVAEALVDEHIATIRFDKRGVGENKALGLAEERMTFIDFIDDVAAIVEAAKKDERFSEVNLIGHSEGSLIALTVAQQQGVDRIISLAGAGRPIDEVLVEQLKPRLDPKIMHEAQVIIDKLKKGERVDEVSEALQIIFRPSVQPYMASWMRLNPQEIIADLAMPILLVNGTTDLQVPVTDAELLKKAQPAAKLAIIEGMNHVLKQAPLAQEENIKTYTDETLRLHPQLLEAITAFINE